MWLLKLVIWAFVAFGCTEICRLASLVQAACASSQKRKAQANTFRALIMGHQSKQKYKQRTERGSKSLFTEESACFNSLTGGKKINSMLEVTQLIWCGADSSG